MATKNGVMVVPNVMQKGSLKFDLEFRSNDDVGGCQFTSQLVWKYTYYTSILLCTYFIFETIVIERNCDVPYYGIGAVHKLRRQNFEDF